MYVIICIHIYIYICVCVSGCVMYYVGVGIHSGRCNSAAIVRWAKQGSDRPHAASTRKNVGCRGALNLCLLLPLAGPSKSRLSDGNVEFGPPKAPK